MKDAERVYKALADWNRLRILKMLEVKPMYGCGIAQVLQIVQSAVSRHLRILTDAELITHEREGSYVVYSLKRNPEYDLAAAQLRFLRAKLNNDPQIAEDKQKAVRIERCEFT